MALVAAITCEERISTRKPKAFLAANMLLLLPVGPLMMMMEIGFPQDLMYDGMRDTLTASQVGFAEEALRLRAEIEIRLWRNEK